MKQYDRDGLVKMLSEIKKIKENFVSISAFIGSLDCLFNALEKTDEDWNELFLIETDILKAIALCVPSHTKINELKNILDKEVFNLEKLIADRLSVLGIEITLNEVKQKFKDLLDDRISREDADTWAYSIIQKKELKNLIYLPSSDRDKILKGVMYLNGVDILDTPGKYLYSKEDIESWLVELE